MDTQLLCLFTNKFDLNDSLDFIKMNYFLMNRRIFVLESKENPNNLFITFNIKKNSPPIHSRWKTILVHRKKDSNTIYTINALNEVIKTKTGGQMDNTFIIDWDEFRNSILMTTSGGYKTISTKIHKTVTF